MKVWSVYDYDFWNIVGVECVVECGDFVDGLRVGTVFFRDERVRFKFD